MEHPSALKKRMRAALPTPLGPLLLEADGVGIVRVYFAREGSETPLCGPLPEPLSSAAAQISAYFSGNLREFSLPLHLKGTPFQLAVWEALRQVPFGETITYRELAEKIDNPRAARAVGMVCHQNPVNLLIPCHRVVGVNGSLTGYAGGLHRKAALLQLEKKYGAVGEENEEI